MKYLWSQVTVNSLLEFSEHSLMICMIYDSVEFVILLNNGSSLEKLHLYGKESVYKNQKLDIGLNRKAMHLLKLLPSTSLDSFPLKLCLYFYIPLFVTVLIPARICQRNRRREFFKITKLQSEITFLDLIPKWTTSIPYDLAQLFHRITKTRHVERRISSVTQMT